ncbi:MAG: acetyl-CoA carboxylase biotin carboxylase subunit [Actinomycetota bacterium]|nr:acetyl-CoA carboxylase biotin carboxylase subunit [Actinomycetota bacterium]
MFKRVLIANRGEIAVRIIRACRELGIETVAVYSTADSESIHTKISDKKICIGPPQVSKSYLNIANIISAAKITGSDAIHPGYGFLAENSLFAKECGKNEIVFIGPGYNLMDIAGNKSKAIALMKENKIPVIPGHEKRLDDLRYTVKIAKKIGYPVIIKASFGGGGKGMRIASDDNDLKTLLPLARSEAKNAFGNDHVYIEKYIKNPRHIEFQIIADNYGNIFSPGFRECSIQRRHQKVIEEAPAINISRKTIELMETTVLKASRILKYQNLGTFEFLLDSNENFYFIEINTRLQVEHPVTEMTTGIDIVKEQIKISSGNDILDLKKNFLSSTKNSKGQNANGHAIEFRINAEDPENDFSPSPGKIDYVHIPGGPGIRFDTFIETGSNILPYYDSLIGKLIVWGRDRKESLDKSLSALKEFKIDGIKTTIPFHLKILGNKNFNEGNFSTSFIEDENML